MENKTLPYSYVLCICIYVYMHMHIRVQSEIFITYKLLIDERDFVRGLKQICISNCIAVTKYA